MENILFEDDYQDTSRVSESYTFVPEREPNMLYEDEEDSAFFDDEEGDLHVVEVNEQMNIDSIWITYAQYFAIWDSKTINPYKIDGAEFKDTIRLTLYDSLSGLNWALPHFESKINSKFGMRRYRWHYGIDLDLNIGDPISAAFDGIVRIVQYDSRGYGRYIVLRHYNGLETLYGHLTKALVQVGQLVKAGETIGLGGSTGRSTGPHLHFEIRYEGNAIDPEYIFDFQNKTLKTQKFDLMPLHFSYLKEARKVFYHTVRKGESLGSISRKYKVPLSTLCRLNGMTPKTILRVGRKIRIR
ncbi:MAG: M23 family metallopeptidase [Cytophagaceae bacterium]|nr:M23 family metallopeptidase [Cytophagaceae bacterium]MDW8455890.1 M23 family metallopeptidase [Cytophagaceae bacterium]